MKRQATAPGCWTVDAACAQADPTLFFPPDRAETGREQRAREQAAVNICRGCPVRALCAQAGAAEEWGVWGGLTEQQRNGRPGRGGTERPPLTGPGQLQRPPQLNRLPPDDAWWRTQLTDRECRDHHAAYQAGQRGPLTIHGEREYQRRRRRQLRRHHRHQAAS